MRGTVLMLCIAALVGCEESTMVGSGCPNGACPEALVRDDDVCTVTSTVAEIRWVPHPAFPTQFTGACLPRPLQRGDNGLVDAKMYYLIESATPRIACTDRPFLKVVSEDIREQRLQGNEGAELCEVNQLAVVSSDGGEPPLAAGDGFYYDDFSEELAEDCHEGSLHRVTVTHEARPWEGVTVLFAAVEKRNAEGEIDTNLSCEPVRGTAPIGAPCALPQTEFVDSQAYVTTNSDDCGQGVCIAYHLQGRIDGECTEPTVGPDASVSWNPTESMCASPEEVAERMYCTCRCDGPPGATDLCDCPDGFSCVDVVSALVPEAEGAYCVKNGRVVD